MIQVERPRFLNDHEQIEDCLAAMLQSPKITYRDLLFAMGSTCTSRGVSEEGGALEMSFGNRKIFVGLVSLSDPVKNGYYEGWMQKEDGKVFVFRQPGYRSDYRVRAYQFDAERDAHDWVTISQDDRKELIKQLFHYSLSAHTTLEM